MKTTNSIVWDHRGRVPEGGKGQLADKNKYIKMLERRVSELEAMQQYSDGQDIIRKHPFPIGVADKRDEQPSTHV